jgi:hypothetical protein
MYDVCVCVIVYALLYIAEIRGNFFDPTIIVSSCRTIQAYSRLVSSGLIESSSQCNGFRLVGQVQVLIGRLFSGVNGRTIKF